MEHVIVVGSAVVSAVTSIPLTCLAVRHHHQMRALHELQREIAGETRSQHVESEREHGVPVHAR